MKRNTKATAKKAVRTFAADLDAAGLIEIDSETITVWIDREIDNYDRAEEAADAIASALNVGTMFAGGKHIIHYKRQPVTMGDFCDRSSRWHY